MIVMRMFGPKGNPQARNLLEVIRHLQRAEGLHLKFDSGGATSKRPRAPARLRGRWLRAFLLYVLSRFGPDRIRLKMEPQLHAELLGDVKGFVGAELFV